jgi:hypothetical protein
VHRRDRKRSIDRENENYPDLESRQQDRSVPRLSTAHNLDDVPISLPYSPRHGDNGKRLANAAGDASRDRARAREIRLIPHLCGSLRLSMTRRARVIRAASCSLAEGLPGRTTMIQSVMLLSIGFLAAALLTLSFAPLVHRRAVRLTTRRLDGAIPASVVELRADKDQLRAQFATSIRRLEVTMDKIKKQTAIHLVEIGKKDDRLNLLQISCDEKNAKIGELEEQNKALQTQLCAAEERIESESGISLTAQRKLTAKEIEFGKLTTVVAERSSIISEQELKIEKLQNELDDAGGAIQSLRKDLVASRNRERSVSDLHHEIDRLEAQMGAIIAEHKSEEFQALP